MFLPLRADNFAIAEADLLQPLEIFAYRMMLSVCFKKHHEIHHRSRERAPLVFVKKLFENKHGAAVRQGIINFLQECRALFSRPIRQNVSHCIEISWRKRVTE